MLWNRWYARNKKKKCAWQKRRRDELKAWFHDIKSSLECSRCDESTPECLQFHHVDPSTKEFEVSIGVRGMSRDRIIAEMLKCIVLCANCHLKHHWEEREQRRK